MTKISQGKKKITTRKIPATNNKVLVGSYRQFTLFQEIPATNYKILVRTGTSTQDNWHYNTTTITMLLNSAVTYPEIIWA